MRTSLGVAVSGERFSQAARAAGRADAPRVAAYNLGCCYAQSMS
jgi:hypothetical protein